jgi:catechol 2,3-dioxygenase
MTGTDHLAIRHPTRPSLARAPRALIERNDPIEGAADRGVSEAIYLHDQDGKDLQLSWDRPRDEWPVNEGGSYAMVDEALELDDPLAEASEDLTARGQPAG